VQERKLTEADRRTIDDYSEQWTKYTDNSGYYGSVTLLQDIFGPLLPVDAVRDAVACDIGSGTGRIVGMLLDAGARRVVAVEPSDAVFALRKNTEARKEQVEVIHDVGEALPPSGDLDLVVSFGVLDHIVDPGPTVRAAFRALKPGGRILVWLYGYEGNRFYLALFLPLRALTSRLPHAALAVLCRGLCAGAELYGAACRLLPLPMRQYFLQQFMKLAHDKRVLTVYDQLRPAYAKYYRRSEALALLSEAGFVDVAAYHRHGYSWTVRGVKPLED
jgi:SAM-dependent methyltransferase